MAENPLRKLEKIKDAIVKFCRDCPLNGETVCHDCYLYPYKEND